MAPLRFLMYSISDKPSMKAGSDTQTITKVTKSKTIMQQYKQTMPYLIQNNTRAWLFKS